jgi:hypothetical protein
MVPKESVRRDVQLEARNCALAIVLDEMCDERQLGFLFTGCVNLRCAGRR